MGFFLFLYNVFLPLGILIASPVLLLWILVSPKTRAGFWQKLGCLQPRFVSQIQGLSKHKKRVWVHAVSVGEFNAIRPLILELQNHYAVVISTTTKTSQDLANRVFPDLPIFYFPFDFRPCVQTALKLIRPDLILITETEIWPNFIDMAGRVFKTPVFLINGRVSKHSYKGYRFIQPLLSAVLRHVRHFYMQTQADADRIKSLGTLPHEVVTVTGNLKFDINPVIDPVQRQILAHQLGVETGDTVLVFASTHSGEDEPMMALYSRMRKDFPDLKVILAPRHPERLNEIKSIISNKSLTYSVRSTLSESNPNEQPLVVLDTIGELLTVYSLATVAIMGGSFSEKGGQNPLEPISQRIPVVMGPDMSNFTVISRMILDNNAGYQVKSAPDIVGVLTELLTQPDIYGRVVENGQQLLENNRGAKEILLVAIDTVLNPE